MSEREHDPSSFDAGGYEQVIVPFDGSVEAQRAALVGADAAELFGSELVLGTNGHDFGHAAESAIKTYAERMSDDRATVWVEPARSPAAAIATMAKFRPRALVCMATHARTGVLRTVYGSLADDVLARTELPLMVIGPAFAGHRLRDASHLVICIDGSAHSDVAIDVALPWVDQLRRNVTLVYVRGRDEVVVRLDERIDRLVERCDIVERVGADRGNVREITLSIASHASGSVIAVPPSRRGARFEGGDLWRWLAARSPVPLLTRGTAPRPVPTAGR